MTPTLPVVRFQPGRHKRVRAGHPWAYSNEIVMDGPAKALAPGALVCLETAGGEQLGIAMFNPRTLIAARVITRDRSIFVDKSLLVARLAAALRLRERLYPGGCYRLIHAEADGLPGLVIDRFHDVLVVQLNSAGMDRLWPALAEALDELVAPRAIVLRNDSGARELEGLPREVTLAKGALDGPVELQENGLRFLADLTSGQKTGWFYDQRDNRAAVARLTTAARILDVYCYGGGFAVAAAHAGAAAVTGIDRSEPALALAARSAALNGVAERCRFERGEAFAELERLASEGARFEVVIADPPAFVKSKKDLAAGVRGYRKLARLAAGVVAPGGLLFIASCSHNVEPTLFAEQVARGLADAARSGRVLMSAGAALDHPVHPALPESAYLKAELLQVD